MAATLQAIRQSPETGTLELRVYGYNATANLMGNDVAATTNSCLDELRHVEVGLTGTLPIAAVAMPLKQGHAKRNLAPSRTSVGLSSLRDLVDATKLVYRAACANTTTVVVIDNVMKLATSIGGGHDDEAFYAWALAAIHADADALFELTGLDAKRYLGHDRPLRPIGLTLGTLYRRGASSGLRGIMGSGRLIQHSTTLTTIGQDPDATIGERAVITVEKHRNPGFSYDLIDQEVRFCDGRWAIES